MESVNRMVGTVSRGVRAPIIREGDNLAEIVVDCVLKALPKSNRKADSSCLGSNYIILTKLI